MAIVTDIIFGTKRCCSSPDYVKRTVGEVSRRCWQVCEFDTQSGCDVVLLETRSREKACKKAMRRLDVKKHFRRPRDVDDSKYHFPPYYPPKTGPKT